MKEQKRVILSKQKLQDQKMQNLKAQLKEAKQMIAKTKQAMNQEGNDSYQTLLSKFVVSEKKLDELKGMYFHLS